jgi:hypothetical protein
MIKYQPGPPMTLGNMREQGVQHLIAYCRANKAMGDLPKPKSPI